MFLECEEPFYSSGAPLVTNWIISCLKSYNGCCTSFLNLSHCVPSGRDASTKIIPDSDVKFFFICNLEIAAKRRYHDLKNYNSRIKLHEVKKALKQRNILDKKRKHSPLKKHQNAVVVNSGKFGKLAMLAKMSKYVERVLKTKYGNWTRIKKNKPLA